MVVRSRGHEMKRTFKVPDIGFFFIIDVTTTVFVIIVVVALIGSTFPTNIKSITATAAGSDAVSHWRNYIMAYHALYGEWPESREDLSQFIVQGEEYQSGVTREIRFSGGAMDLILGGRLDGEVLTVHPAVPAGDPGGPVRFVTGNSVSPEEWTVTGEDHTTVDTQYIIPKAVKR